TSCAFATISMFQKSSQGILVLCSISVRLYGVGVCARSRIPKTDIFSTDHAYPDANPFLAFLQYDALPAREQGDSYDTSCVLHPLGTPSGPGWQKGTPPRRTLGGLQIRSESQLLEMIRTRPLVYCH